MSIDKSLRKKGSLARARNVLRRDERIAKLKDLDRWEEGRSPFGLPKVRVYRLVAKKTKKKKEEETAAAPGAATAAAPTPAAATPEKKSADKKPPDKKAEKK